VGGIFIKMTKKKTKIKTKTNKKVTNNFDSYLKEVTAHWNEASAELSIRKTHKSQGMDEYDRLYRSVINSSKWPYNTKIFIPLTFQSLFGKGTRLVTGKVKGKLVPLRFNSELGARIGTELLMTQYDDHDHFFGESLVAKWLKMDQNARKYGAAFGLVPWRKEKRGGKTVFDGPTFQVLDNRKTYLQPGAISLSNSDYVIVERMTSLHELKSVNQSSVKRTGKFAYHNLEELEGIEEQDNRDQSVNTTIRGLSKTLSGIGEFKKFRILTEYRDDKWITWVPGIGSKKEKNVILRVVENPYNHMQKPIIRLVYIPIDDDIVGMSEIEPGRSEQKAINALTSGFIEAVSTQLYPIIKGHPTNVDWKTIEFKPRAAWIMNNPQTDLIMQEGRFAFVRSFVEAYKLLTASFSQSMGETASNTSQLAALSTEKTATEIKDLALQRGSRDNLNKLFLSAAITKMYNFWWDMDKQFLTNEKVVRVTGKEAIEYFTEEGLSGYQLSKEGYNLIDNVISEVSESGEEITFEEAYELLRESGTLDEFAIPMFPSLSNGQLPKLKMARDGKSGFLSVNRKDLNGQYRFIVDLDTIGIQDETKQAQSLLEFTKLAQEMSDKLQQEGYQLKSKELLEAIAEKIQIKGADRFFGKLTPQQLMPQAMPPQGMPPQGMPQQGIQNNEQPPAPEGIPQPNLTPPSQ